MSVLGQRLCKTFGKAYNFIKNHTKQAAVFLLVCIAVFGSMASVNASSTLFLDVSSQVVYHNIDADKVIDAYDADPGSTVNKYNGEYRAVVGYVRKTPSNWNEFLLEKADGGTDTAIKCIGYPGDLSVSFGNAGNGGLKVKVLGKLEVSSSSGLTMIVDAVDTEENSLYGSEELWTFKNLKVINKAITSMKSLGKGEFTYYIPKEWEDVEEKLPNVEGNVYKLNKLDRIGKQEYLFVFYVDSQEHLENSEDGKNTKEFAKAIVKDIMGPVKVVSDTLDNIIKFDRDVTMTTRNSDFTDGVFYYCTSTYMDKNNNDFSNHNVEFVFLPGDDSGKGMKVFLYVYPITGATDAHRDEILYVIRSAFF